MVVTVYQYIVEATLEAIGDAKMADCAIGEKTVAVETSRGTGVAMYYAGFGENRSRLAGIERAVCRMRLTELVSAYLATDSLYHAISLAAINSILNGKGAVPAPDYRDMVAGMPKGACLGLICHFAPVVWIACLCGVSLRVIELKDIPKTFRPENTAEQIPLRNEVILTGSVFQQKFTVIFRIFRSICRLAVSVWKSAWYATRHVYSTPSVVMPAAAICVDSREKSGADR